MKKVARLRIAQQDDATSIASSENMAVRTTGRIKKPKAVFDPSDNYLPRSQRVNIAATHSGSTVPAATGISILIDRKRDTPILQNQDTPQNKRLSQSSITSIGTSGSVGEIASTEIVCEVCQKREAKRGTHARNKLISCLECERRVHKLCLQVDFEDIDILRQNYKCENCRTCDVCDAFNDCEPKINQPMVTCSKCVKSYHLTCHIPNVFKYQQTFRWKCNKCQPCINNGGSALPVKTIREIIGDDSHRSNRTQFLQQNINIAEAAAEAKSAASKQSTQDLQVGNDNAQKQGKGGIESDGSCLESGGSSTTSTSSTTSSNTTSLSGDVKIGGAAATKRPKTNHDETINSNTPVIRYSPYEPIDVPDVKDWNADQVATYFAKYFPNEAHVFKEHEIDGTSLLLLKRSDVIKKLPIKLGPSLRIYSLILKIQTQLNDPTLGWNCGL
ncbi:uncharacterized protein LOC105222746 [Bactrocera dorsalis]|uniref:Uncharacterized protein LOC105222746 n=1 Tax=Bactrocera dorsalis TaxID=27457 RepID=A0A6I9UVT1_BACDO|nr:uncharacterized protein LOC105222746 [Bactrocera dorsalis]